ncbi:OmpA family protein [Affinibrenneria salicis]|uniref:OmpA family protein n=1 Tax=Affinibrenneria salicis TaxID=2590031 RepID=A0A5J5FTR7_9GAMM|nr:OmpA family protein [Affinibrenneria salicis]KAA8996735.1 OmpA family protein [Affinibrenneria salicis]
MKKIKAREWLSAADLKSSVMAVVMLILVVAVLQHKFTELKLEQTRSQEQHEQKIRLTNILQKMQATLRDQRAGAALITVDVTGSRVMLRDNIFAKGSACITDDARTALSALAPKIAEFIQGAALARIMVEGHTDSLQVANPVTDYARYCTVYDDNFTLSAARAREARKLLIAGLTEEQARRVIVAGFGDSEPLPGTSPDDPFNRRIEVQFFSQSVSDSR